MKKYTKPELIVTSIKSQDIINVSAINAANQLKEKFNGITFGEVDIF